MDYKKRISELQNQRNWSMNRLAVESGLNPSTISNWFSRGTTPTTDAIEKLCGAFGISIAKQHRAGSLLFWIIPPNE
jgi:transcriptional regulator with XRE-family HTH domain